MREHDLQSQVISNCCASTTKNIHKVTAAHNLLTCASSLVPCTCTSLPSTFRNMFYVIAHGF